MYDDWIYAIFKRASVRMFVAACLFACTWYIYQYGLDRGALVYGPMALCGFGGIFILILPMTFIWPDEDFDEDREALIAKMAEEKRRAREKEAIRAVQGEQD